jgi:hypothetical protein
MDFRSASLALAVYLPLAVCSQSLASPQPGTPIAEQDIPRVKAGHWRHVLVMNGIQSSGDECDAGRRLIPPKQGQCSKFEVQQAGGSGKILFASVCKDGSVATSVQSSSEGDLSSAFASDVIVLVEAPGPISDRTVGHESYQDLGSCPIGMKPEDR